MSTSKTSNYTSSGDETKTSTPEGIVVGVDRLLDQSHIDAQISALNSHAATAAANLRPLLHDARAQVGTLGRVVAGLDANYKMTEQAAAMGNKAKQFSDAHTLDEIPKQAVAEARALAAKHRVEDRVRAAALQAKELDAKHNGGKIYGAYKTGLAFMSMLNHKESREAFGKQQMMSLKARYKYHLQQQQQQQQQQGRSGASFDAATAEKTSKVAQAAA